MDSFFQCQESKFGPIGPSPQNKTLDRKNMDVVCGEEILGAFKNA
jgi:hypothetical protein